MLSVVTIELLQWESYALKYATKWCILISNKRIRHYVQLLVFLNVVTVTSGTIKLRRAKLPGLRADMLEFPPVRTEISGVDTRSFLQSPEDSAIHS